MGRFDSQPLHLAESGHVAGHGQKHAYPDGLFGRGRETLQADYYHKQSNYKHSRRFSVSLTVWMGDGVVQNSSLINASDKMCQCQLIKAAVQKTRFSRPAVLYAQIRTVDR